MRTSINKSLLQLRQDNELIENNISNWISQVNRERTRPNMERQLVEENNKQRSHKTDIEWDMMKALCGYLFFLS